MDWVGSTSNPTVISFFLENISFRLIQDLDFLSIPKSYFDNVCYLHIPLILVIIQLKEYENIITQNLQKKKDIVVNLEV